MRERSKMYEKGVYCLSFFLHRCTIYKQKKCWPLHKAMLWCAQLPYRATDKSSWDPTSCPRERKLGHVPESPLGWREKKEDHACVLTQRGGGWPGPNSNESGYWVLNECIYWQATPSSDWEHFCKVQNCSQERRHPFSERNHRQKSASLCGQVRNPAWQSNLGHEFSQVDSHWVEN